MSIETAQKNQILENLYLESHQERFNSYFRPMAASLQNLDQGRVQYATMCDIYNQKSNEYLTLSSLYIPEWKGKKRGCLRDMLAVTTSINEKIVAASCSEIAFRNEGEVTVSPWYASKIPNKGYGSVTFNYTDVLLHTLANKYKQEGKGALMVVNFEDKNRVDLEEQSAKHFLKPNFSEERMRWNKLFNNGKSQLIEGSINSETLQLDQQALSFTLSVIKS